MIMRHSFFSSDVMNIMTSFTRLLSTSLLVSVFLLPTVAQSAGGISIQGTRIIYPQKNRQVTVYLTNHSITDTYLVQSWVEATVGGKTKDFIVTPPLYVSKPQDGNSLRLMYVGGPLPEDREMLYYFVTKAIPSVEKNEDAGKSSLILAAANRIKLFVRPDGLEPEVSAAPELLSFRRVGTRLEITNSGPYYVTMTDIKSGNRKLNGVMVPPKGTAIVALPTGSGSTITYRTLNDYGALTPMLTRPIR